MLYLGINHADVRKSLRLLRRLAGGESFSIICSEFPQGYN